MSIITVSGEMGSLRDELAVEICQRSGMECVDRLTLMEAVDGLVDITRDEHQLLAEQGPALLDMGTRKRRVFSAFLETVVLQYAQKSQVVLVGRGANLLLRLVPGVLRLRTVAPLEIRASRLAHSDNLELDRARQLATVVDQQRRAYVAHVFGSDWSSALNYDMVLNMGRLTLEQAATTILDLAAHPEFQISSDSERLLADMVMAAKVRRAIVADVDIHALEVESNEGRVHVAGYVASQQDQIRALELIADVDNVGEIDSVIEVSPTLMKFLP